VRPGGAGGLQILAGLVPLVVLAGLTAWFVIAARRGAVQGPRVVVRCRAGHVFTTVWIPGVSLKSIRLGAVRFQWCPAGAHWTFVTPVPDGDLTGADRLMAGQFDDGPVP
jgi:hypothetical protein